MSSRLNLDEVQKALDRAAYNACHGPPSKRDGRFDHEDAATKKTIELILRRILQVNGFELQVARRDHDVWRNPITQKSAVVPCTGICRHNANATLIQAGLTKAF